MKKTLLIIIVAFIAGALFALAFNAEAAGDIADDYVYHCRAGEHCYILLDYDATILIDCTNRNNRFVGGAVYTWRTDVLCMPPPR